MKILIQCTSSNYRILIFRCKLKDGDNRNVIRGIAVNAKQRSSLQKFTSTYNEDSGYWFFPSSRKKESEYKVASTYSTSLIQIFNSSSLSYDSNEKRRNNINSIKIHCTRKNNLLSTLSSYHFYTRKGRRNEIINRFKIFLRIIKNQLWIPTMRFSSHNIHIMEQRYSVSSNRNESFE